MTKTPAEAFGGGPDRPRFLRAWEPLRDGVAELLGVPPGTATALMVAVHRMAVTPFPPRQLDGQRLAPRVLGDRVRVSVLDDHGVTGEVLRADLVVRVEPPNEGDPEAVHELSFVLPAPRVLAAGTPGEVDREWPALGVVILGADRDDAPAGVDPENRPHLDALILRVLGVAGNNAVAGWSHLKLSEAWPSGRVALLWLGAPTPEGHRMAEVVFNPGERDYENVKLLLEAGEPGVPLVVRVLGLGAAWAAPMFAPVASASVGREGSDGRERGGSSPSTRRRARIGRALVFVTLVVAVIVLAALLLNP